MKSDEVVKAVEWKMNVCLLLIGGILKLWHEMYSQWVYPGLRQSERVKLGDEEYSVRRWIEETPLMLKLTLRLEKNARMGFTHPTVPILPVQLVSGHPESSSTT